MRSTTIEVWQGGDWYWYWHAVARNGEVIAASEGYTRKADAARGARRAFPAAKVRYL